MVRDPKVHEQVIVNVIDFARETGFTVQALTFSPVKGPEGNIEYLVRLTKSKAEEDTVTADKIKQVVIEAHAALDK